MCVRSQLSQAILDSLAMAWSRLDRARPPRTTGVPGLLSALDEWVRWAMRVDDELTEGVGASYATRRAEQPGGAPLAGLRHVHHLTQDMGHPIEALVTVSAGSPAIFYDVAWRAFEDLPRPSVVTGGEAAYRQHLAGRPARMPAASVTTFLLSIAVEDDDQPAGFSS